jgi:hypothetical protein
MITGILMIHPVYFALYGIVCLWHYVPVCLSIRYNTRKFEYTEGSW